MVLYFNEMESKKDYCVAVEVQQVFEVNDAKDANVKIYDYYQPERVQSVSYNLPRDIGQGMIGTIFMLLHLNYNSCLNFICSYFHNIKCRVR